MSINSNDNSRYIDGMQTIIFEWLHPPTAVLSQYFTFVKRGMILGFVITIFSIANHSIIVLQYLNIYIVRGVIVVNAQTRHTQIAFG